VGQPAAFPVHYQDLGEDDMLETSLQGGTAYDLPSHSRTAHASRPTAWQWFIGTGADACTLYMRDNVVVVAIF